MLSDDLRNFNNEFVRCPHCGHEHHSHDDPAALPWTEDSDREFECSSCGREFFVLVELTVRWTTAIDEDDL